MYFSIWLTGFVRIGLAIFARYDIRQMHQTDFGGFSCTVIASNVSITNNISLTLF